MRILVSIAAAALAVGLHVGAAQADSTLWSSVGSGCAAGDPAIQNNRYLITSGSVKHQSTNVDVITLYCPVTVDPSGANVLKMTYRDSTGDSSSLTEVKAALNRMSRSSGAISTIATLDSDNIAVTSDTEQSLGFTHTFDFESYYYYVRVDLDRNTTSDTAILYGVSLAYQTSFAGSDGPEPEPTPAGP